MGNVTSGLIETALQSSPNSSASSSAAESTGQPSSGQDNKLRDQIRQFASDPSKLELYRLLQKEMEKQASVDPATAGVSPNPPKTEQSEGVKNDRSVAETDVDGGLSSKTQTAAPMLCPKKKFLKGYLFGDDEAAQETKMTVGTEDKVTLGVDGGSSSPSIAASASLAADGSQSVVRSRSYTVSLPVRSRGPHDSRGSSHAASSSKAGEQHPNPQDPAASVKPALVPFDMNQCIDAVVRSQIAGVELKSRDQQKMAAAAAAAGERYESRPQYIVDREHGPASSVAAYSSAARQLPRRDDMTMTAAAATMEMSRMAPERASSSSSTATRGPRHMSTSEVDASPSAGSIGPSYDSTHGYYYSDQHAAAAAGGKPPMVVERSSSRSSQQFTKDRVRQHPGPVVPPAAGGYQMEHHAGGMVPPPAWRQNADPQGNRMAQAQRSGPPSWPGHQPQQQGQQPEIYQRMAEHSKEYDGGGGSAAKYRIMEVPAPSVVGYQQQYGASEVAGRAAVYDQRTGYPVESRSKYLPVDVSRAAYPPTGSRSSADNYDTARRQVHEQIEAVCLLPPPPLLKQRTVQRTPPSGGAMMQTNVVERQHPQQQQQQPAMLPRPLEPVEPIVRPKIPGLMHTAEIGAGFDRLPPSDVRIMGRSAALQTRDDREYAQCMQRQSRSAMSQQQQQQLGSAVISPPGSSGGLHHRIVSQLESSGAEQVVVSAHRQHTTVESPLDLSLRKDEPVTMTAEAFLRRVQDPEHYAATRQEYVSRMAYSSHDSVTEMDTARLSEVRRAEYRMQQQYQQQVAPTVSSSSGGPQQYQHSRHESPRTRIEAVPDWVSSRAPPVGLPADQQRVPQSQTSRRQVFVDNSRTSSSSYAGVSPGESRMHHSEMAQMAFVDPRQQADPLPEESVMTWERRMQATERARMQAASWDATYGAGPRSAQGMPVSDLRAMSSASSVVSNAARYDQRAPMVGQPPGGMPGNSQRMANPALSGSQQAATSVAYDSRQSSRPQHHPIAAPAGSQPVSGWTPVGTSPAGSTSWLSKDRQERAIRQDRMGSDPSPPSDLDPRRGRSFVEAPAVHMARLEVGANPPDLCRNSGTTSPSLPQLSPIPQSGAATSGSSNTAANRRIPIVQLLGSHSPSDILHLRCNVCSLTYGSLRSFRMHFAKVHGLEPGPEHFTIQTISETRTAIARGGVSGGLQDLNAVDSADESSLPPPSLQRETGDLIAPDPRCTAPSIDSNTCDQQQQLQQQQRREFLPPVKQVAEVYPIPKKSSPVVVPQRPSDPGTPPEKPSPPVIAKRTASDDNDHQIRCHKCHQFSTQDLNVYRRHVKMHATADGRSSTPDSGDAGCYDTGDAGCAVCLEGFADVADWQSHVSKSHHITSECMMRSCACKACDLGFTNAGALRRHLAAVHGVMTSSVGSAVEVEYRCLFCPDSFSDERELHAHTQAHEHHYIAQRKTTMGSMPLSMSRRFAFMRGALSSATTHRVQTAVPDTTCPEDQRLLTDATASGGNSKSGSEDGQSLSSDKSPQADVTEDGNSGRGFDKMSDRGSPSDDGNGSRTTKTMPSWTPRTDSLKASILRRLSAGKDSPVTVSKTEKQTAVVMSPVIVRPPNDSTTPHEDQRSSAGSSPSSDKSAQMSSQTVFGDLVTLMHREVENSLRGFSVELPQATTATSAPVPVVSVGASSPSSRTTRCVRDVCDAIIANSFRQSDDTLPPLWPTVGPAEPYIDSSQQQQQSPDGTRRSRPSSVDGGNSSRVSSRQQPLAHDNDEVSPPGNVSDSQSSPRSDTERSEKSTGSSKKVDINTDTDADNQLPAAVVDNRSEVLKSLKPEMTGTAVSGLDTGGAVSDSEHPASDIDPFDDQPPLCIDLNRATSEDEEEVASRDTGELPAENADEKPEPLKSATGDKTERSTNEKPADADDSKPWRKRTRAEMHESDKDTGTESVELRGPKMKKQVINMTESSSP